MSAEPDSAERFPPADFPFAAISAAETEPARPVADTPLPTDFASFKSAAFRMRWTGGCLLVIAAILLPMSAEGPFLAFAGAALALGLTLGRSALNLDRYARTEGRDPQALAAAVGGLATVVWIMTWLLPLVGAFVLFIVWIWLVGG